MPRPILVELVGAPGAGKSTVFDALRALEPRVVRRPILTRRPFAMRFAGHVGATAADFARRRALGRGFGSNTLAMAAELRALPPLLDRWAGTGDVLVFDQGPLFTLTRPKLMSDGLRGWWDPAFERWARLLDIVVWLDAPDEVLATRIRERPKTHRLKDAGAGRTAAWLARDRELFERILARAQEAPAGPAVLRFDTSAVAPEEVAAQVLAAVRPR